jgi:hypothetical protein
MQYFPVLETTVTLDVGATGEIETVILLGNPALCPTALA